MKRGPCIPRLAFLLVLSWAAPAEAQKSADTLRILWPDTVTDLDPTRSARRSSQVLAMHIWDTLVYRDPDTLQLKPLIAVSWRQVDDATMDFVLRPDWRFTNGDALTADDVAYSVAASLEHLDGEPVSGFTALAGADVIDRQHIRLHFTQGVSLGMEYLAMLLPILPREYRERIGAAEFARSPVGSGPYQARFGDGGSIVLDRNEQYPAGGAKPRAAIAHLVIFPTSGAAAVADLIAGNVDWTWGFDPDQMAAINAAPNVQALRADSLRIGYLNVTVGGDTPFGDVRVRQAVFHAINRVALVRRFGSGSLRVLNAPCFPTQFGCDQAAAAAYDYNPAQSKQELADAGYASGFSTVLLSSLLPSWGAMVQADLRAVGIDATLRQVQPSQAAALARSGQAPLVLGAWGSASINDVAAILPHFFGGGPADQARDPELQAILASGRTADPDRRRQADQAAIRRITAQAYMLPMTILVDSVAFTRDLVFHLPPDNLPRFYQASWR